MRDSRPLFFRFIPGNGCQVLSFSYFVQDSFNIFLPVPPAGVSQQRFPADGKTVECRGVNCIRFRAVPCVKRIVPQYVRCGHGIFFCPDKGHFDIRDVVASWGMRKSVCQVHNLEKGSLLSSVSDSQSVLPGIAPKDAFKGLDMEYKPNLFLDSSFACKSVQNDVDAFQRKALA